MNERAIYDWLESIFQVIDANVESNIALTWHAWPVVETEIDVYDPAVIWFMEVYEPERPRRRGYVVYLDKIISILGGCDIEFVCAVKHHPPHVSISGKYMARPICVSFLSEPTAPISPNFSDATGYELIRGQY